MKKPIFALGLGLTISLVGCLTNTEADESSNSEEVVSSEGANSSESINTDSIKQEVVDSLGLDSLEVLDSLISSTVNLSSFSEICTSEKADWDLAVEVTQDCINANMNAGANFKLVEEIKEVQVVTDSVVEVEKEILIEEPIFLCQEESDNEALAENAYLGCLSGEIDISSIFEVSSQSEDSTEVVDSICLNETANLEMANDELSACIAQQLPTPPNKVIREDVILEPVFDCNTEAEAVDQAEKALESCENPIKVIQRG